MFRHLRIQGDFGQGLRDTNNGFELSHSDWDTRALVVAVEESLRQLSNPIAPRRFAYSRSTCCTCFRSATKCEESFSAASGAKRGAQRLKHETFSTCRHCLPVVLDIRFAVGNVALHLVDVDFAHGLLLCSTVHMQVHDAVAGM